MPTVLVTGAAGFIGSHLASALIERGHHVLGIDNFDPFYDRSVKQRNLQQLPPGRFTLVEADIRDRDAMTSLVAQHQPESIFHLAALAGVRPSLQEPARFASVNLDGLVSMLDAARTQDGGRFVFASSSSVYGDDSDGPSCETDPADRPISPYAATKRSGELICHAAAHAYGMRLGMMRLFTVYGPGQRPDLAISKFLRRLADDRPIPMFGNGRTSRDYTYVDDIITGLLAADAHLEGASAPFCRAWNLGGGNPVTLDSLIERLGAITGHRPRIEQLPAQPGDVGHTQADLSRSRAELGYDPRTALDDGLRRQWDWMQSSGPAATVAEHSSGD